MKPSQLIQKVAAITMALVLMLAALPVTQASAAIGGGATWYDVYHSATLPGASAASFTVDAGSNRMLVVMITSTLSGGAAQTISATYGGQAMTLAAGDAAAIQRQHSYLFYQLENAVMDGSAHDLSISMSINGLNPPSPIINDIFYTVLTGVNQSATPLRDAQNYNSGITASSSHSLSTALTVNAGDKAVAIYNLTNTANTIPMSYILGANWSTGASLSWTTTNAVKNIAAHRTIPAGNTTDTATISSISPVARASISAMSVKSIIATTVTPNPVSGTYGDSANLSATISPVLSGVTIDFTLDGAAACSGQTDVSGIATCNATLSANVGNYPTGVNASFAGDADYAASSGTASLDVAARPVTVTADSNQTKVYGDADPAFTYQSSESVSFTGALDRDAGEDVGLYAITQGNLDAGTNYSISFISANFEITKKPVTATADAGQSKLFGQADPVFTYTSTDPSAPFTGALTRDAGESLGAYNITQGTLALNSNYDLAFVGDTFTINAASAPSDVTLSNSTLAENKPADTLVGTLASVDTDQGDTFTYAFACATPGADDASFSITGTDLKTAEKFNYEVKNTYAICVRSTDSGGLFLDKNLAITVTDVNELVSRNSGLNLYWTPTAKIPRYWSSTGFNFAIGDGKNTTIKKEGTASVQITGDKTKIKILSQTLKISGPKGDSFTFAFWQKGTAIPVNACRAQVFFYLGTQQVGWPKTINCNTGNTVWKPKFLKFAAPGAYDKVVIKFTYAKATGKVWFDLVRLYR